MMTLVNTLLVVLALAAPAIIAQDSLVEEATLSSNVTFSLLQIYTDPNCDGKMVVVQLFEWSWDAIASECETFLGPKGFCGVQVSPPAEHIQGGEWWARYQHVSYNLDSRSGNRQQFVNMVQKVAKEALKKCIDYLFKCSVTRPG